MTEELYNRQKSLNLRIPEKVTVIGVGGVGSWVALNLALVGTPTMILIDHDIIEESNLNRTPFKITQVGRPKVEALAELIFERRPDAVVVPIQKKLEDLTEYEKTLLDGSILIDCRDTEPLSDIAITGGYDGYNITIHINPQKRSIWGDEPVRYTITPSFVVPPQIIASFITLYLCVPELQTEKEIIRSFDIRELFKQVMGYE